MAIKILAACLSFCVLATQGAVIREEDDVFFTALQTLLTEPEMLVDTFGLTREKRHAGGPWDFDRTIGGTTIQIKYKDPANRWKGGHAHFEIQDLKKMVPIARSHHVNLDITFDGGDAPRDLIFNLKVDYTLEHGFEEKGTFLVNRKYVGSQWITDMSNKKNGGGNGIRIFPLMEHTFKTDRSTKWVGTYNSARFQNVNLNVDRVPGKKVDGTFSGTFLGKPLKVTLHGTRNSATNKLDGTLTVECAGQKYDFKIDGKRIPGSKLEVTLTGNVKGQPLVIVFNGNREQFIKLHGDVTATYGGRKYVFRWNLNRQSGTKLKIQVDNAGMKYEVNYKRSKDWSSASLDINMMKQKLIDLAFRRKVTSFWNRKSQFKFEGNAFGNNAGTITLQSEKIDDNTKKFTIIADKKTEKEVLKYVNTISVKKEIHGGHNELDVKMVANLDLKESSMIHKFFCTPDHSSIHCFNHRHADVSLSLNLDEPWHVDFHAKLDKDGKNVVDVIIDTKSHHLKRPYVVKIHAPRILPATFDIEAKYVGKNIIVILKKDNKEELKIDLNSPDGKSPFEFDLAVAGNKYKVSIEHLDKNGDGEEDFLDVKVFKNGPKVFDFEVDRSKMPHTFVLEYPAKLAFWSKVNGKFQGSHGNGKLHFHYKPGKGKDLEIDITRTHKDSGKHERHYEIKIQRNSQVYYDYISTVTYGGNPSQLELDANSKMTVSSASLLHSFACNHPDLEFLCFNARTMMTKFRADRSAPYKMELLTKVDKDGTEVFKVDLKTKKSPYELTFNWPRMREIVAPYRKEPLHITADHKPGQSLAVKANIRGFDSFSVQKLANGKRKIMFNGKELIQADFQKGDRSITKIISLPNGKSLTSTIKWGNEDSLLNNNFELDLDGTERKLDAKVEWHFNPELGGNFKIDAVGWNKRWGNYNLHRTGKATNIHGVWTLKTDGTSLWKGKSVTTDSFVKLDTSKVGNGKLDAITAKIIKVVDGKKFEVNIKDGKIAAGEFVKIGAYIREMSG